jgi:hypothetical protein
VGGHYELGNLQVVCRFVNRRKNDGSDAEFRRLIGLRDAQGIASVGGSLGAVGLAFTPPDHHVLNSLART